MLRERVCGLKTDFSHLRISWVEGGKEGFNAQAHTQIHTYTLAYEINQLGSV